MQRSGFSYSSTISTVNFFGSSAKFFAGCMSTFPLGSITTLAGRSENTLNITAVTGPISMWGQPLSVEFQKRDLSLFTTTTATDSSTTQEASAASTPSSAIAPLTAAPGAQSGSPAAPTTNPPSSNGPTTSGPPVLSPGAAAGIGVGATAALIVFFAVLFVLFRKKPSRPKTMLGTMVAGMYGHPKTPRMEADGESRPSQLHEEYTWKQGTEKRPMELEDERRPSEIGAGRPSTLGTERRPAELGSSPAWI